VRFRVPTAGGGARVVEGQLRRGRLELVDVRRRLSLQFDRDYPDLGSIELLDGTVAERLALHTAGLGSIRGVEIPGAVVASGAIVAGR
jgi:hypothetical protein